MGNEVMDLEQLASYLQRDARELNKMANRGHLPGQKIGGQWRFASAEINHWIETQMHAYTEQELTALETAGSRNADREPLISVLLSEASIGVPLRGSTITRPGLRSRATSSRRAGSISPSSAAMTRAARGDGSAFTTTRLRAGEVVRIDEQTKKGVGPAADQ